MGYSSEQPSSEAEGKVEQKKNVQGHEPCVFVLCDPPSPCDRKSFYSIGTGVSLQVSG